MCLKENKHVYEAINEEICEKFNLQQHVVGVPASSLSRLRGPWPENPSDLY